MDEQTVEERLSASATGDLSGDMDALRDSVSQISEKVEQLGGAVSEGQDLLSQKLDLTNSGVGDVLDTVRSAGDAVDYTQQFQQLGQLLAVTDLVLIVLCVVVFLAAGLYIGHLVTAKLKVNGG